MGRLGELRERCYAFLHADVHPDPFPQDAWADPAYARWFEEHRASEAELLAQRSASFEAGPLFSIVVPLFKTPLGYLDDMVRSVLAQTYRKWELILVNASPESEELRRAVEEHCAQDERVRTVLLEGNLGITENTNRGIAKAAGEFVCFLDHDDIIEPDALFEYARALEELPDIDVLYCDEDLVSSADGRIHHVHPLFKPSYSPNLLLCKNYIVHLMTIRRSLIERMPRPDSRFDGVQDYNMVLFCSSHARRVHNVERVLYHWRMSEASTASNPHAKPYSRKGYRLAAIKQLEREGSEGRLVTSGIANIHNVWFPSRASEAVSIVVLGRDEEELAGFVEFFGQVNTYDSVELIEVLAGKGGDALGGAASEGASCDLDATAYERLNEGAQGAHGDYLLFLAADSLLVTPEPIEQLLGLCHLGTNVAVGPQVLYRDNRVRSYGMAVTPQRIMPLCRGYADDFPAYQCNMRAFLDVSSIEWCGMMVRRSAFEEAGGFDAAYQGEIGTADLCKRLRDRGGSIALTPLVKVQTMEPCLPPDERYDNSLNAREYTSADLLRYDEKWPGSRDLGDPFFNRNLDQGSSYYQIGRKDPRS